MNKLSLVIPVYNEQEHLELFVRYLMRLHFECDLEVVFVDDCSKDNSLSILKNLQSEFKIRIVESQKNGGKGSAVRLGIKSATGDVIMVQDADFEYDPRDIPELVKPIFRNEADVVFGSRFKKNALQVHRTYHYFVNRLLTLLSNLASGIYLTDMETCYKAFRADLIKSMALSSERFGIEVELTAFVAKTSARILEFPIAYYPRTKLQGKKINWRDGVAALFHIVRFNRMSLDEAYRDLPVRYRPGRSKFELFVEGQKSE